MRFIVFWRFIFLIFAVSYVVQQVNSQEWMRLAHVSSDMYKPHCDEFKETQRKLCMDYAELVPFIIEGAQTSHYECRYQLRWRRWNCMIENNQSLWKSFDSKSYPYLFGKSFELKSKEAAFVSAIFSAGFAYKVTKACSSNQMQSCSCHTFSNSHDNNIIWGECSDNVVFGMNFAKKFIDSVEWNFDGKYTSFSRSRMNLHNNEVGRNAIKDNVKVRCGCHGVSGSCTTRICSRELSSFRAIGSSLRRKYDRAVHVELQYINTHHLLIPINKKPLPVTPDEMIYLDYSPAYCDSISGRRCKKKATSKGSCENMCCDHGYRIKERMVTENCHCRFIWCCNVTCKKCKRKQRIFTCK